MGEITNSAPIDSNPQKNNINTGQSVISASKSKSNTTTLKPSSKFSIKAIIGVIIFLLLAGGAAAGYVYREPIMKLVSNTPSPTPSPIVAITPTPDPDSAWTIFKGNGFEFSHPVNAPVSKGHGIIAVSYIESIPTEYPKEPIIGYIIDFGYSYLGSESLKSKAEERIVSDGIHLDEITKPITKIIIGSYEGLAYSSIVDKQPQNHVFLRSGTNYIDIAYFSNDPNNKGYQTIIDRILSTFKFTESKDLDTSNWKSFKDANNYFTFKYPNYLKLKINSLNNLLTLTHNPGHPYTPTLQNPMPFTLSIGYEKNDRNINNKDLKQLILSENKNSQTVKTSLKPYINGVLNGWYFINDKFAGNYEGVNEIKFLKNDNIYNIYIDSEGAPISTEIREIVDQILSTFIFTDFQTSPTPTCTPRPKCLDATPRCMIPEPIEGWCM